MGATPTLTCIQRFPVKGLGPDPIDAADLLVGAGLPHDRRFALARGDVGWDPAAPRWLPKQRFVMLMRDTELARVGCRLDGARGAIELTAPGRAACAATLTVPAERVRIEAWVNDVLGPRREGPARFVEAGAHSLTDVPQDCLSLINLASVRALAERMGEPIQPLRFRGNLLVDGLAPWAEFDWVGSEVGIGGATVRIAARIPRCAATGVNPETGVRDRNVVKGLRAAYGHYDMGVYAEVVRGGRIAVGDAVRPPARARPRSWLGHWLRFLKFLAESAPIVLRRR